MGYEANGYVYVTGDDRQTVALALALSSIMEESNGYSDPVDSSPDPVDRLFLTGNLCNRAWTPDSAADEAPTNPNRRSYEIDSVSWTGWEELDRRLGALANLGWNVSARMYDSNSEEWFVTTTDLTTPVSDPNASNEPTLHAYDLVLVPNVLRDTLRRVTEQARQPDADPAALFEEVRFTFDAWMSCEASGVT